MTIDKSIASSGIALLLIALGVFLDGSLGTIVLSTGLFALSGGVTNWLAIHMLFERIPGLYGSGVIPLRFEEFKVGIRELIMEQFFDRIDLESFLGSADSGDKSSMGERVATELGKSLDAVDLDTAFDRLLDVILASSFGGMLGMLGGRDALAGLREPFIAEMKEYLASQFSPEQLQQRVEAVLTGGEGTVSVRGKLEEMIDGRLNEMTPEIVKVVIQNMIKKHLGWLVVWGAVFGGVIGFGVSIFEILMLA